MTLARNLSLPVSTSPLPAAQPVDSTHSLGVTVYRGIAKSLHFIRRAEERGLREEVLEFVLTYGTEWRRMGASHLTVVERDLPPWVRGCAMAAKAKDWIVVITDGDLPITCYRRTNAVRFLRRKDKRSWSETQIAEKRQRKGRP